MPGENDNETISGKGDQNSGVDQQSSAGPNTGPSGPSTASNQPSAPAGAPAKPFPEPKVIEAVVDPKQKQKEAPAAFSFTKPQAVQEQYSQPSKGDVARAEEKAADTRSDAQKLADLDAEIAKDERSEQVRSYSDYHDTAEMFILGWESILMFFGRAFSKDTSDTAYGFSQPTREKLIHQATKVSRKRNWVIPIEYMFGATLGAATAGSILKAKEKRKEYFKNNPPDKTSELIKGGPFKDHVKTRGPGRPRVR